MKLSPQELLIIFGIILLIFGPTQIPKLVKIFKKSAKSVRDELVDDEQEFSKEEQA